MSDTKSTNTPWPQRFGKLVDVTERTGKKGAYATFKGEGNGFDFYGACFDEAIIAEMKAAVGKRVWMKGPLETRMVDGEERRSFKAIYFRVSEEASDEGGSADSATAETEAAEAA